MTLRDFCKNKIESSFFRLSLVVLVVSLLFSTSLYLKKIKLSIHKDLKTLEIVILKINKTYEIKRDIEEISAPDPKNPEILMAQLIDSFNSNFPEMKMELSQRKTEGQEVVFPFSVTGEGSFKRYVEITSFLQKNNYPACFINSVSLKAKEQSIDFTIKGEFRLISNDRQI